MGRQKKTTPETYPLRLSNNALQNIDEITGYIAFINHQPMNAIKVGEALFQSLDKIASYPFAFKECVEIPTKQKYTDRLVVLSWSIIYKINADEIIVLGIIHQSGRPSKLKALRKIK